MISTNGRGNPAFILAILLVLIIVQFKFYILFFIDEIFTFRNISYLIL